MFEYSDDEPSLPMLECEEQSRWERAQERARERATKKPSVPTHVLAILFYYRDGSIKSREMMRGSHEECAATMALLSAASTDDPEVVDASAVMPTVPEWESILATGDLPEGTVR